MIHLQHKWLDTVPWESVLTVNKALCQAQKQEPATIAKSLEAARQLWESAGARTMSLEEVLDVCRRCHELGPFTFSNGNTFAAIGRTLIEDWLKSLTPVEAQIVRTTVGHYIVGLVGRRELLQVLGHFKTRSTAPSTPAAASSTQPLPASLLTQPRPQT